MLFDITACRWDEELCALFGVPAGCLPSVAPSSGRFGTTAGGDGVPAGVPISGIAGDQQAALFGQACFTTGMTKNTYGTGSFVLMNVGASCPPPVDGLLSTIAWQLEGRPTTYALEGAIFVTGAAIQWLRDGLGLITETAEIGPLAASVAGTDGCYIVPAFTGLGSPYWDPYARGTIVGITRGTSRAHLARAVVEAMAFQTRDVVESMAAVSGHTVTLLRADGGASVMDVLLQSQADQLCVPVARPQVQETTALGAAYLAGLAEGVWADLDEVASQWALDAEFYPARDRSATEADYAGWQRAVARARHWEGAGTS
jgi:glycerol kinase